MTLKNKMLLLTTLFIILLITFSLTTISYFFLDSTNPPNIINFFVEYHLLFMFIVTILALFLGALSFIVTSKEINNTNQTKEEILKDLLEILNYEEKEIIKHLRKNNGISTQYELINIINTHKVKIHRILERLEKKNIIEKKKIGKINKIYLNKKLI